MPAPCCAEEPEGIPGGYPGTHPTVAPHCAERGLQGSTEEVPTPATHKPVSAQVKVTPVLPQPCWQPLGLGPPCPWVPAFQHVRHKHVSHLPLA